MHASFPTLGQVMRFAFAASGVLPRKRGEDDGVTEQDKKRIQQQLKRLADEDGKLLDQSQELISQLSNILAATLTNTKALVSIGETTMDLFEVYNAVVQDEGTFLGEQESIAWFCRIHAIPRLVLSIQKHLLRFNVAASGLITPDEADWYLPTFSQDGITWPLAKAMRWAYRVCDTNRTRFHYPGKSTWTENEELARNLANAEDWCEGRRTPSWTALHWTFSRSFEHLASIEDVNDKRDITESLRESILLVLFLARLSTYVCKALAQTYGQTFLEQLVSQFQQHRAWLAVETASLRDTTADYIREKAVPASAVDEVWWQFSDAFWRWFSYRSIASAHQVHALLDPDSDDQFPEETVADLISMFGDYGVRTTLEKIAISSETKIPDGFAQWLHAGLDLKSNPACSDDDIDRYEYELHDRNLSSCLGWLASWLRAVARYRAEDYRAAFDYIEEAFQCAKYRAGKHQYKLVNQYVELAAKVGSWKSFTKGIAWARYLGLQVRWLRDKDPTEENLRFVFATMKVARYAEL